MDFEENYGCISISRGEVVRRTNRNMSNLLQRLPAGVPRRHYHEAVPIKAAVELEFESSAEEAARKLDALADQLRQGDYMPV